MTNLLAKLLVMVVTVVVVVVVVGPPPPPVGFNFKMTHQCTHFIL